jgi:hypothetical protein
MNVLRFFLKYFLLVLSGTTFKSLIYFKLNFMYGEKGLVSFFYIWISSFPNTIY